MKCLGVKYLGVKDAESGTMFPYKGPVDKMALRFISIDSHSCVGPLWDSFDHQEFRVSSMIPTFFQM